MLACEERGDRSKPAVLFLHGFLGSGEDWAEAAGALCGKFRCLLPDLPGHGQSAGVGVADLAEAARGLLGLLDDRGVEACSVVGYSMGGRLGLYLALEHPERVERAVIESASPGLRTEEERAARRRQDEALASELERAEFGDFLRRWYGQPLFASLHGDQERSERLIRRRMANEPRALAGALRSLGTGRQPSLWEALGESRVPLVFVAGDGDAKYTGLAREMAAVCPGGEARIVAGCGHNVHLEKPAEYTRLLKRFLDLRF